MKHFLIPSAFITCLFTLNVPTITFAQNPPPAPAQQTPPPATKAPQSTEETDVLNYETVENNIPMTGNGLASASFTSPNAFGSGYALFSSGDYINHWSGLQTHKGGFNVGTAFGDAYHIIGGVVAINIGSTTNLSDNNADISFRINRYIKEKTAIAVGMDKLFGWGAFSGVAKSFYAAITHRFALRLPLTVNGGFGTGDLYSPADFIAGTDHRVRPFLGAGLDVFHNFTLLLDYTANSIGAGGNYNFELFRIPFFANLGVVDLTKKYGSRHIQFGVGAAYLF